MRILVVSSSFPRRPGDSLSPFIWEYCRSLQDRGWEVTALVPHHRGLESEEIRDNIKIVRFKYLPEPLEDLAYSGGIMPGLKNRPWRIFKLPFFIYSMYSATLKITRGGGFDLVNFQWLFPACFWAANFARRRDLPIVLTGHGTDVHLALRKAFASFARKALRKSAALTLNSNYMKKIIGKLPLPERTEVIPMGVDTERFFPGPEAPSRSKKIIFVGRLIRQKGGALLIQAFARVSSRFPQARLEIIGDGPEKPKLIDFADRFGIERSITFSDPVNHPELPQRYRQARALALPSLIPEGLGMTALEAGACGVPTVTFGLGGTSEFVEHEKTGLITGLGISALADGLERILTDDCLVDRLGASARTRALESYGWERISGRFDSLYRSIL